MGLAADLAERRLASRRPKPEALVFPASAGACGPSFSGATGAVGSTRRRQSRPGLATRDRTIPHSYASLRIAERANFLQVAAELGHDARLTLSTYGHLFDESVGVSGISAEQSIRAARAEVVSKSVRRSTRRRMREPQDAVLQAL